MKRIEAFIQSDKLQAVVAALGKVGLGGFTVINSRGQGQGQRPMVEGSRGTGRHIAEFNSIDTVITIVDDAKVNDIVSLIANEASTGSKGDGKIFVSNIESATDIGSKQTGSSAL